MAASLPAPGPLTQTSTLLTPDSRAILAETSAAIPAAKGVLFFDPLKPLFPAEDQVITFPRVSVIVTIVLLKVAWIWAIPDDSALLTFFLTGFLTSSATFFLLKGLAYLRGAAAALAAAAFLVPTVFLGPFLVRALVLVL